MRTNGSQRPEEILAEIDRTREEMDRTLSAIEHRLTPGQLVDQGMDYLRHSGANEFVQNLGGTAKQNPLPVALTAIGIAWLMAIGRQPAQPGYGSSTSSSALRERAGGAMQSASEGLSSAKESIDSSMNSIRDRAGSMAGATRQQWERARGGVDYMVREQPLALGAIGLAVGALLGAIAPRTQKEEELMGEASRNLMEKAKETGSQQLEKAQQTVKQVAEKATGQSTGQQGQSTGQQYQTASKPSSAVQTPKPAQTAKPAQAPTSAQPPTEKKGAW